VAQLLLLIEWLFRTFFTNKGDIMLGNYLGGMLRWGDASTNAAICGGTHAGQFIFTEPGHACVAAAACCVGDAWR
jgi:hypothetical protein